MTKKCLDCSGSGKIRRRLTEGTWLQRLLRQEFAKELCSTCSGTGTVPMSAAEVEAERCRRERQERLSRGPRPRNEMDRWPEIVADGEQNPNIRTMTSYLLTKTSLDNPLRLQVSTEQQCFYCTHFGDPEFRDSAFPKGGGYCGSRNGAIGFDQSCKDWAPTTKVKYWLSRGYMANNHNGYPRSPWYKVFDDGPDGAAGAR
jgi:hypothetical protein